MRPTIRLEWQRILGCETNKAQWPLIAVTH